TIVPRLLRLPGPPRHTLSNLLPSIISPDFARIVSRYAVVAVCSAPALPMIPAHSPTSPARDNIPASLACKGSMFSSVAYDGQRLRIASDVPTEIRIQTAGASCA